MRIAERGFTLIELSIVLVIIGLIVGGVLVGRDLIAAAGVRAQISQIEKYQQAVNAFRGKYGYLPGDIKDPEATQFGFISRGQYTGQGDGNGVLVGQNCGAGCAFPIGQGEGETAVFWVDLSRAGLIDGSFNTAKPDQALPSDPYPSTPNGKELDLLFPRGKLGRENRVLVWSGGALTVAVTQSAGTGPDTNYFSVQGVPQVVSGGYILVTPDPADSTILTLMTVKEAYSIDAKIDDAMPQSGTVLANFIDGLFPSWVHMDPGGPGGPFTTQPLAAGVHSCFDNSIDPSGTPGVGGNPQHYSIEINNGTRVGCSLSFKFQ